MKAETKEEKHRRSLLRAIEDARRIAAECGEKCYIIHSEIYANSYFEYDDIEHVVGTRGACACMFERVGTEPWGHVVGVVDPDGEWFLNRVEDTLIVAFDNPERIPQKRGSDSTAALQISQAKRREGSDYHGA